MPSIDPSRGLRTVEGGWNRALDLLDGLQRRWRPTSFAFGVFKKFLEDRGTHLAALIAYYGLLSIFPLLILMVTVVGYVLDGRPELRDEIVDAALSQFPALEPVIQEQVQAITGDISTVILGLAGAVWAGLAAMNAAETAMNAIYHVPRFERPNPLERRLRALGVLGILGLGLIASTVVVNLGRFAGGFEGVQALWLALGAIAVNTAIYALAFHALVDQSLSWGEVVPGAILAGATWWALTSVGGYYVERNLDQASATYGALAIAVALLAWFYIQGAVTVLAAEFNVVLRRHLWPRSLTGRDLTPADVRAFRLHVEAERLHKSMTVDTAFGPEDGSQDADDEEPDATSGPEDPEDSEDAEDQA